MLGIPLQPVRFTADSTSTARGQFRGLHFAPTSTPFNATDNSGSLVRSLHITYAGSSSHPAVLVRSTLPSNSPNIYMHCNTPTAS